MDGQTLQDPVALNMALPVNVTFRCPKGHTFVFAEQVDRWAYLTVTDAQGQVVTTGPLCPTCLITFFQEHVPVMERVAEQTLTHASWPVVEGAHDRDG